VTSRGPSLHSKYNRVHCYRRQCNFIHLHNRVRPCWPDIFKTHKPSASRADPCRRSAQLKNTRGQCWQNLTKACQCQSVWPATCTESTVADISCTNCFEEIIKAKEVPHSHFYLQAASSCLSMTTLTKLSLPSPRHLYRQISYNEPNRHRFATPAAELHYLGWQQSSGTGGRSWLVSALVLEGGHDWSQLWYWREVMTGLSSRADRRKEGWKGMVSTLTL